jgi:uncharacterized protein (DUF2236 family)
MIHFSFLSSTRATLVERLQRRLAALVYPPGSGPEDFAQPAGEPALLAADSVTWRVFANPLAMFVGGVTAVLLELAEPRVRTGVWEHTAFRTEPLARMRRTGHAAMMTAYGPRSRAEAMIARINAGHARIRGHTPAGQPYAASDVELLTWVHATAAHSFLQAYVRYVRPLSGPQRDAYYAENAAPARLYGVLEPVCSERGFEALLQAMRPRLEPSAIVLEFLDIVRRMPLLPLPLRGVQRMLAAAAVQNLPAELRAHLGLDGRAWRLGAGGAWLLRRLARATDDPALPTLPAVAARRRVSSAATPDAGPAGSS